MREESQNYLTVGYISGGLHVRVSGIMSLGSMSGLSQLCLTMADKGTGTGTGLVIDGTTGEPPES